MYTHTHTVSGHFPDGRFPDRHFPDRALPRLDISPNLHYDLLYYHILLFYYDFNLDVELLVCALVTNSIHSNRLTEQPFVLFNLLFCCLIITVETHQKYHRGILKLLSSCQMPYYNRFECVQ